MLKHIDNKVCNSCKDIHYQTLKNQLLVFGLLPQNAPQAVSQAFITFSAGHLPSVMARMK